MRNPRSRIGLVASVMASALLWLPLPAFATFTWINVELYASGDLNLSALDPITVVQVGLQNCDPDPDSGDCSGEFSEASGSGVEFAVRNVAGNLPADLGGDAFLGGLYFASPKGLDLGDFSIGSGTTEIASFDVSGGTNAGYKYAWSVDFVNDAASGDRLLPDDFNFARWFIEGADVSDFLVEGSANGNGNSKPDFLVMAHLQQVGPGPGGTCSLKYVGNLDTIADPGLNDQSDKSGITEVDGAAACASVPEPSSVALLGIGVLLLAGTAAWRRRRAVIRIR